MSNRKRIFVVVSGAIVISLLIVTVAMCSIYSRDILSDCQKDFEETVCTVQASHYPDKQKWIPCKKCDGERTIANGNNENGHHTDTGCITSSFPCLNVDVVYHRHSGEQVKALMFETYMQLDTYPECSTNICYEQEQTNSLWIDEQRLYWDRRITTDVICYVNPFNASQVVLERYDTADIPLWSAIVPGVLLFAALIVVVFVYRKWNNLPCTASSGLPDSTLPRMASKDSFDSVYSIIDQPSVKY
ncbi:unnamed protein product [Owenia fusiformis]|uniref:Uncharacterized protein n=1 Tax=Owenia fusiformis TaxID=6347 RepID=A0A8J1Y7K9_OWEFU|nr:unnamed protein product [Owenia fusiformis]